MIVIADTSPLNYLVLVGEADILHKLYGRVLIPEAVFVELQHPDAPRAVVEWMNARPTWLEIHQLTAPGDKNSETLDAGEREALALAEAFRPDVLLVMDDETGRQEARRRSIPVTALSEFLWTLRRVGWWTSKR